MAEFIVVHADGYEIMVNLDLVQSVVRKENGKAQITYPPSHGGNIDTDESYDEVKRRIWR